MLSTPSGQYNALDYKRKAIQNCTVLYTAPPSAANQPVNFPKTHPNAEASEQHENPRTGKPCIMEPLAYRRRPQGLGSMPLAGIIPRYTQYSWLYMLIPSRSPLSRRQLCDPASQRAILPARYKSHRWQ